MLVVFQIWDGVVGAWVGGGGGFILFIPRGFYSGRERNLIFVEKELLLFEGSFFSKKKSHFSGRMRLGDFFLQMFVFSKIGSSLDSKRIPTGSVDPEIIAKK